MKLNRKPFFHRFARPLLIATAALGLAAGSAASHIDYFLKIEGVPGESADKDHKEWINILSISQAVHRGETRNTTVRATDRVLAERKTFKEMSLSKQLDSASPKLLEAVCNGTILPHITINFVRTTDNGRQTYYKYELENVLITSYNVGGSGLDDSVPVEHFSLNFEQIKVTYNESDSSSPTRGNVEFEWKVEKGE